MELYTQTDIGLVRSSNQDAVEGGMLYDGTVMWAVLCDGMGGANGGSVASDIATTVVRENIGFFDIDGSDYQSENFLREIIDKANNKVYRKQRRDITLQGMGTTMELVVVKNNWAMVAHVGDSRVYHISKENIRQVTVDHSVVQEMVDRGELTPQQAMVHPVKNYITRAVGVNLDVQSDYIEFPFKDDDIIIVCSDGLSNYIPNDSILSYVKLYSGTALTEALIEAAKKHGGGDNISVAVLYANNIRE
ncbi:MAG: Stp1/IreP family PP2C-type Ser/Thr phosphatase [Acutalibacteraceae bacterium]|nr:Stp1/IreP family PP2C-type Ser/Thr phosphatase [Acutalibacteraceae bacterium]